jgi:hypothetical protein
MNRREFILAGAAMLASRKLAAAATGVDLSGTALGKRAAVSEPLVCLNVHPSWCEWALPLIKEARVRHVRSSWWEWSRASEWSWVDRFRADGVEVLPILSGGVDRRGIQRYETLRRSFGPFPWIQLENEPDYEGADRARGREIGRYLRTIADHIRSRDPGTRICAPGLGWTQPGVHDFLRGMIDGANGAFDALSIHVYGHHPFGEPLSRWKHVRAVWPGEIWCTEVGQDHASTRAFLQKPRATRSELDAFQTEAWRRVFSEDPERGGYRRIYGFHLGWDEWGFGLLNADRSPRPAFRWFAARPRSG